MKKVGGILASILLVSTVMLLPILGSPQHLNQVSSQNTITVHQATHDSDIEIVNLRGGFEHITVIVKNNGDKTVNIEIFELVLLELTFDPFGDKDWYYTLLYPDEPIEPGSTLELRSNTTIGTGLFICQTQVFGRDSDRTTHGDEAGGIFLLAGSLIIDLSEIIEIFVKIITYFIDSKTSPDILT